MQTVGEDAVMAFFLRTEGKMEGTDLPIQSIIIAIDYVVTCRKGGHRPSSCINPKPGLFHLGI